MANETIVLNGNLAPFVDVEADAGEADIYPGNALELDANGDFIKSSSESSVNTQGIGRGVVADINEYDPSKTKTDAYPSGDRVHAVAVPIGGETDVRLAAGGDLDDSTKANVTAGDVLEEVDVGAFAKHDGTDTTGDGTGAVTETVYAQGALYEALESVDNSGAAAGVSNQTFIEVRRIA